ncbi:MAG: electron transfer flavoprotein beta subunit/FixA family protein [Deltaproteobacteria bacterium]|nr:electron transfer flavoprotein beta subunit/FixA family protein [Deltaproteobacteria bacterium]
MNIIVCIKQVPGTADVRINPADNTLVREDVPNMINPFDLYAIEEGLRLRDRFDGKVTVITMGPPQAAVALKESVALGVDDIILLSDRAFAGSDTWATAYALSLAVKALGPFDIVLCGKQAIDGDTGQVGPGLARQLGVTQLTYVFKILKIVPDSNVIVVDRLLEEGHEIVEARLPALLTVVKDINQPRSAQLAHIRRASKLKARILTAKDLSGVDHSRLGLAGSPTKVVHIFSPPKREGVLVMIEAASVDAAARQLADKILAENIL